MRKPLSVLGALAPVLLLSGCLYVPPLSRQMSEEDLAALQVGKTTRAEVLERFGKPNRLDHGQFAVYEGSRDYGVVLFLVGQGGGADLGGTLFRILLEFDEADLLKRFMVEAGKRGLAIAQAGGEVKSLDERPRGEGLGAQETIYAEESGLLGGKRRFLRGAVSPDGQVLAAVDGDGHILLRHLASGTQRILDPPRDSSSCGGAAPAVAFSWDGKTLALVLGIISLFDTVSEQEVRTFQGHRDSCFWSVHHASAMAFAPDSSIVASGDHDGILKIWNPATGLELRSLTADSGEITSVAFSPDGRLCATAGRKEGVKLWDTATWTPLASPSALGRTVAFSPDGKILAIHTGDHVEAWQLRAPTREPGGSLANPIDRVLGVFLLPPSDAGVAGHVYYSDTALAFSPDREKLAAASSGAAVLVDLPRSSPVWRFVPTKTDLSDGITDLVFQPDSKAMFLFERGGVYLRQLAPEH